jgi:glucose/arabinose dehydrogenase
MKWVKRILITLLIIAAIIYGLTKYLNVNPPNLVYNSFKGKLPLNQLKLPVGFVIDMYAENVKNARSLCLAPEGTLFVGTRSEGKVYAIKDFNNDHKADTIFVILKDGNMPNGVAFKDGTLYIAEVNRILAFDNILNKLSNPGEPRIVYDKYPEETHHGWKYIAFGPDGKLYVPVGAPCNICESVDSIFNTITRINTDGTGLEIVQKGVRNTVGFDWQEGSNHLFFTDNGRDLMGDEVPECELNQELMVNILAIPIVTKVMCQIQNLVRKNLATSLSNHWLN